MKLPAFITPNFITVMRLLFVQLVPTPCLKMGEMTPLGSTSRGAYFLH
jgi:hypothetical protein